MPQLHFAWHGIGEFLSAKAHLPRENNTRKKHRGSSNKRANSTSLSECATSILASHFCCLVSKSCLTLWDPMDCSKLDFPAFPYLPEFTQIYVHWLGDAIQLSHPLLLWPSVFPSIRVFSNNSLSASGGQSIGVIMTVLLCIVKHFFINFFFGGERMYTHGGFMSMYGKTDTVL